MTIHSIRRPIAAALISAWAVSAIGPAAAQGVTVIPKAAAQRLPARTAAAAEPIPATAPVPTSVHVPEGTEVRIKFDEALSSATSTAGDTFSITTDEEMHLADGTTIAAGYRGKGEVTEADKKGMMGKPGQLNVRLSYVRVGDVRLHLRASKGAEGKDGVTSTIILTVLFGPLGLIKHGHDVVIPRGQTMVAYVDEDTVIPLPLDAPPRED
ncbi:MAG TPA: hypothetical protein VGI79_16660 [Caulobacteraceae bacterium]|jgi:hypothetical protein